jgi:pimeloyl-ACP methyl ester carboxylesterase
VTTYLLVHGAWHSGECWNRVAAPLTAAGHRVFAPTLTGHGEKATAGMIELAEKSDTPWRVPPLPELPAPLGLFGVNDPDDVAWLRATLVDEPVLAYRQPVRLDNPAAQAIPRTHIHCVGFEVDGITRRPVPATQPNGAPAQVWELRSGHDCMITVPAELAALLLNVA